MIFIIPLLLIVVTTEYILRQFPTSYKYKYDWMQRNAGSVKTLVLGSSHALYGIRPDCLDTNAFNLANVSQRFAQDLYLLKRWKDEYKNLKTVILPISTFSFFARELEYGQESYRCRFYRIYMNCDLYPFFSLYNLEISDYKSAKDKMKSALYSFFVKKANWGCDKYGWSAHSLSEKNMNKWNNGSEAEAAVTRHTAQNWDYINKNYNDVKDIAEFCKQRQIQLVFITIPCWHSYYDNFPKEQLSKMHSLIRSIQQEYNIFYFDYLKDKRFNADDFYDSNHLSDIGATKFTNILNKDIQSISKNKP